MHTSHEYLSHHVGASILLVCCRCEALGPLRVASAPFTVLPACRRYPSLHMPTARLCDTYMRSTVAMLLMLVCCCGVLWQACIWCEQRCIPSSVPQSPCRKHRSLHMPTARLYDTRAVDHPPMMLILVCCCGTLWQLCVWCEEQCTRKVGRSLIHPHCNTQRIAQQRSKQRHEKRSFLKEEASPDSQIQSQHTHNKRSRIDPTLETTAASDSALLLALHTEYVFDAHVRIDACCFCVANCSRVRLCAVCPVVIDSMRLVSRLFPLLLLPLLRL